MEYLYLAIAIVAEVGAASALKASDALTHLMFTAIVLIGYVMAYYISCPLRFARCPWHSLTRPGHAPARS